MTTESPAPAEGARHPLIKRAYIADAAFVIMLPIVVMILVLVASCGYDTSAPYQQPPPSSADGLWMGSSTDETMLKLSRSQLMGSRPVTQNTAITTPSVSLIDVNALAFHRDDTLWIASADDSSVVAFQAASLSTSGNRQAIIIKSNSGSLDFPVGIVIDADGSLWVLIN